MARETELLLSYLNDRSTTFLNSECGETSPEADTLGSRTMPLRLISKSADGLKPRNDRSADRKYRCYKCLDAATVLKSTIFSTRGRQLLAVPPSPCRVMIGSWGVLFTRSSWLPCTLTDLPFGRTCLSMNYASRITLAVVGLWFGAVAMVVRGVAEEWSYSSVGLILWSSSVFLEVAPG